MAISHAYVAVTNDLNQDQRMHRICNTIQSAGYSVTLIGRSKNNSGLLYKQSFSQHRLALFFQSGVLFYLEYQIRLFVYLMMSDSPRIMLSVDLDTALPIRLAARLRRSISIHDAHELFTDVPELVDAPLKRWIWTWIGKMTMQGFDYRFTVNNSLSNILSDKYRCPFTPLKNLPIARTKSSAILKTKRAFIWYQGVINQGRGLEQMIDAMRDIPELDLRIAGEGDLSHILKDKIANSIYAERIIFHGWMNPIDMHNWASNAWLGINLLDVKSGNYYHSLANKTFDYIQAELPALHMNFPEYISVVEQYKIGILLDDIDTDTIASAIKSLQNNKFLYKVLKSACRDAKLVYTWDKESNILMQKLKEIKANN